LLNLSFGLGCLEPLAYVHVLFRLGSKSEAGGHALLLIYPNPAGETAALAVSFEGAIPTVLEIYDAAGRLSRSLALALGGGGEQVWQLPLDGLAVGQYAVLLRGADGQVVGAGLVKK
jgi:hypothetical protein